MVEIEAVEVDTKAEIEAATKVVITLKEEAVDTNHEVVTTITTTTTGVVEITTILGEATKATRTITIEEAASVEAIKAIVREEVTRETMIEEMESTEEATRETTIEVMASREEDSILTTVVGVPSVAEVMCHGAKTQRPLVMLPTNSLTNLMIEEVVVAVATVEATKTVEEAVTKVTTEEITITTGASRIIEARSSSVLRALDASTTLINLRHLNNPQIELT